MSNGGNDASDHESLFDSEEIDTPVRHGGGAAKRRRSPSPPTAAAAVYWVSGRQEEFATKIALHAAVTQQEHPQHETSVSRTRGGFSNAASLRIVCVQGKDCSFHVNAREHSSVWTVTTFQAEHSCASLPTPDRSTRSRTYNFKLVREALGDDNVLNRSNPSDLIGAASRSGLSLRRKSAKSIIAASTRATTYDELLDYHLLPAAIAQAKLDDPHGVYILEEQQTEYSAQTYRRYFAAFGSSIRIFHVGGGIYLVVGDGAHMKTEFGGILLLAVTQDANKEIVLLAHAVVSSETADNAAWFYNLVRVAYPKMSVLLQDEGTGLNSHDVLAVMGAPSQEVEEAARKLGVTAARSVFMANCSYHAIPAIQRAAPGVKGIGTVVNSLTYARTPEAVASAIAQARQLGEKAGEAIARRERALSQSARLAEGLPLDGVTTNQLAESANNMFEEERYKGPTRVLLSIAAHESAKFTERQAASRSHQFALTPPGAKLVLENKRKSTKYQLDGWITCTDMTLSASMRKTNGPTRVVTITRDPNSGLVTMQCPCLHFEEYGCGCGRCYKLLELGNERCSTLNYGPNCWNWKSSLMVSCL